MGNKESSSGDFSEIGRILESIRAEFKTEMQNIKTEIKAELDAVKAEVKADLDNMRNREPHFREPPEPPGRSQFGDFVGGFVEREIFGRETRRKTQDFPISNFTGVDVGGAFEVEIVQSDTFSVSVTAEEELFGNLDVTKEGDVLRIGHSRHIGWRARLTRPRARVTMPILKGLEVSGASEAIVKGFSSTEALKIAVSGASRLSGEISAGDAEFRASGASRVRVAGSAKDVIIEASGASHIDLESFSVRNAAVRLSGASHGSLKMDGRLDVNLSGASRLGCSGNPVMGTIRTSGASSLNKE